MADTDSLDRPDLDALQKLADEAAPGPWTATHSDMCCNEIECPALDDDGQEVRIATAWAPPDLPDAYDFEEINAAFIAAARSAVPALISYARSLESQLAEAQAELLILGRGREPVTDADLDRDEIESLRSQLAESQRENQQLRTWASDVLTRRVCAAQHPTKPDVTCTMYAYAHPDPVAEHHGSDETGAPWSWPVAS